MKLQSLRSIRLLSFLLVGTLFLFTACKDNNKRAKKISSDVFSYVYAYTSGTISKTGAIKVRFTKPVVETDQVGKAVENGLFSLSPKAAGTTIWENDHTLVFVADDHFESGQNYMASVALAKLFDDVPSAVRVFEFDFKIKDIFFEVNIDGLIAENPSDLSNQLIAGKVFVSDEVDSGKVEALLTARQNGKVLNIRWEHSGNHHNFLAENVIRGDAASKVEFEWNGKAINIDSKGAETVQVPALGDFEVMQVKMMSEDDEPYFIVHFSDPILKSQELEGLIQVSDYDGDLRFDVNGNKVRCYPSVLAEGVKTLTVNNGIKNVNKRQLKTKFSESISFESVKPKVRLAGKGVVVPTSKGLIFPFEAVGLNEVDVEVFKIYNNNIIQYLQVNNLNDNNELERVGNILLQERVDLKDLASNPNPKVWTRYAIDLASMVEKDPNAIYQVRIGFKKSYVSYDCNEDEAEGLTVAVNNSNLDDNGEIKTIWDYYSSRRYNGFRWSDRENPCKPAYYMPENFVRRNVIASNIGIIAKRGEDGALLIATTDLRTTDPLAGVKIDLYNYDQQLLTSVTTDGDGRVQLDLKKRPWFLVAEKNNETGYLPLNDGYALSLSRFDTGGAKRQKGLKGYVYGERGVWRPGDSLYLNFVLEDAGNLLPDHHPINFELYDPRGQLQEKITTSSNVNRVYPLHIATTQSAPTGNWRAIVKVGGATFTKSLKIETVKPNRMKVKLDFGQEKLFAQSGKINGNLQVNWLHGAPARNLKAISEVNLVATTTKFSKFNEYLFDDPSRTFYSEPKVVFDGQLNNDGNATVSADLNINNAPGVLKANFKTRAFEEGGDFSTDVFSLSYYPYETFAGIFIPKNQYDEKRLDIGKKSKIDFVLVDKDGNAMSNKDVSVGLYRVNWRWWWDSNNENLSKFNSSQHIGAKDKSILTTNAKGEATWDLNVEEWGRYLVRICDTKSGHCSGDFFYAGYPWGDDNGQNRDAAAMLAFSSDKNNYSVGDKVELTIPASDVGRCLISVESGGSVLETYWKDTKKGDNKFSFYATAEMVPNVYANVTLIQPHAQVENDLPIRLYGVIPIKVEDAKTRLQPMVKMPDVLKPKEKFTIEVNEKDGRPMAYTIAVVDDGLLDLTRFETPNPWNTFFAKEALGVKTWDMYDYVLGANGGELERVLSIGGDVEVDPAGAKKANRFKPVVMHLGPFYSNGKKQTHELTMPNYVGSVRTMVVASGDGAYGKTAKTTPVRKPLMLLATLPRVLGPGEKLDLPVNIFAMEDKVKDVTITVKETSGLINFVNGTDRSLHFSSPGDEVINFNAMVGERVGIAKFLVTATGGGETATQEIELDVRNPNPFVTNTYDKAIEADKIWAKAFDPVGMPGTNEAILEVSQIPPINMGERLQYLLRYPHGCIEQTTSSGFPQLYVGRLIQLDETQKRTVKNNVEATIKRLKTFQMSAGGFTYWPGGSHTAWGSNYAGHFILEAEKQGFVLPVNMKTRWAKSQKKYAKQWSPNSNRSRGYYYGSNNELEQAYRLYTLALAQQPELGAMNRMREMKKLSDIAKWRLAAAYALAGKSEVADAMIQGLKKTFNPYRELSGTFGSNLRDEAMVLETLTTMNKNTAADGVARSVAEQLSADRWHSTQTVAYSLMAVAKHVGEGEAGEAFEFSYQFNGSQMTPVTCSSPIMQLELPVVAAEKGELKLENKTGKTLYARIISTGQPLIGDNTAASNNLKLSIAYKDMKGRPMEVTSVQQGTDFFAEVTVTHPNAKKINYQEMALTQVFPAGWEIHNARMDNLGNSNSNSNSAVPEYQDVRDDRVYTYFSINQGQKQTYRVQLNAAYLGRFYLPTVSCEAMYDNTISARVPGGWVDVVAGGAGI